MSSTEIANIFGFIAGGLGIFIFLPQVVKIAKTKDTRSLSLLTYALLALSSSFWIVYSALLNLLIIFLVNIIILISSLFIVVMKLRYG